jgi:hypothetical protein
MINLLRGQTKIQTSYGEKLTNSHQNNTVKYARTTDKHHAEIRPNIFEKSTNMQQDFRTH